MRTLPSSTSAGNLRRLANGASEAATYSSHVSSIISPPQSSGSVTVSSANAGSLSATVSESMTVNDTATSVIAINGEKKRLAYFHTTFHEMLADHLGKSFERRKCNYCGSIFSFRTTSAPLRHMRKLHPEKFYPEIDNTQSNGADNDIQSTDQVSTEESRATSDNNVTADAAASSRTELQRRDSAVSVASWTASEEDNSGPTPKRRRGGEDEAAESRRENSGDTYRTKVSKTPRALSSQLTASQEAILHFLHHYDDELPQPAMRLKFARHLTYNVAEAEMYNVLDPATQLEFIREFALLPSTS